MCCPAGVCPCGLPLRQGLAEWGRHDGTARVAERSAGRRCRQGLQGGMTGWRRLNAGRTCCYWQQQLSAAERFTEQTCAAVASSFAALLRANERRSAGGGCRAAQSAQIRQIRHCKTLGSVSVPPKSGCRCTRRRNCRGACEPGRIVSTDGSDAAAFGRTAQAVELRPRQIINAGAALPPPGLLGPSGVAPLRYRAAG